MQDYITAVLDYCEGQKGLMLEIGLAIVCILFICSLSPYSPTPLVDTGKLIWTLNLAGMILLIALNIYNGDW